MTIEELEAVWLDSKKAENDAKNIRLEAEKQIVKMLKIDDKMVGTRNFNNIKIVGKTTVKIDRDKLIDIGEENNIDLTKIFKWTPTINKKIFDEIDDKIKFQLSDAITSTPAKITITIKKDDKNGIN